MVFDRYRPKRTIMLNPYECASGTDKLPKVSDEVKARADELMRAGCPGLAINMLDSEQWRLQEELGNMVLGDPDFRTIE